MSLIETKICSKCNKELPRTTEYFNKGKTNKDGFRGWCKTCEAEYKKEYRKKNKEIISEKGKQYYQENREGIIKNVHEYSEKNKEKINKRAKIYRDNHKEEKSEYSKKYNRINKEKLKLYTKKYREEHKEKIQENIKIYYAKEENKNHRKEYDKQYNILHKAEKSEYHRQYYKENKETKRQYINKWSKNNKDKINESSKRRRFKEQQLLSTLTDKQWEEIKLYFNNKCAYCGKELPLTQEHFIPVFKDGEYTINNIICACKSCNSSKGIKDFFEWYPKYEYYSKERENKILKFLHIDNPIEPEEIAE